MSFKKWHFYNNIPYTLWPFIISVWVFCLFAVLVILINKYFIISECFSYCLFCICFTFFIDGVMHWVDDVREESICGRYTKKLRSALYVGFMLFLLSELMLFGSFFWVYFDRIFHLSYVTHYFSSPLIPGHIKWFLEPLYASFVLLTSGYFCNSSYYNYQQNKYFEGYIDSLCTNFLGFFFIYIQYVEYTHLTLSLSDHVYSSIFFLLTGFHGAHVLIGNIFLLYQYWYIFWDGNKNLFGLTLALIYWHFVDIIWIFLFIFVYFFNTNNLI